MIKREIYSLYPEIEHQYAISRAIKIRDIIYLTGMTAMSDVGAIVGEGNMSAQCNQIFHNIQKVLQHFGADLENIVEQTVFTTDISRIDECVDVVKALWGDNIYPTAIAVEVRKLAAPAMLVEIKATAHL